MDTFRTFLVSKILMGRGTNVKHKKDSIHLKPYLCSFV